MAKDTPKTTLKFKEVSYPFYRTVRGTWDYENAGFTIADMAAGKLSAQYAYIFFQLRDCAKRAGLDFKFSLDQFVDEADGEDLLNVFERLNEEKERMERLVPQSPKEIIKKADEVPGEA